MPGISLSGLRFFGEGIEIDRNSTILTFIYSRKLCLFSLNRAIRSLASANNITLYAFWRSRLRIHVASQIHRPCHDLTKPATYTRGNSTLVQWSKWRKFGPYQPVLKNVTPPILVADDIFKGTNEITEIGTLKLLYLDPSICYFFSYKNGNFYFILNNLYCSTAVLKVL